MPDIAPDFSPRIEDDEESNADSPDAPAGEDDDDDDDEQPVRPIRTGQPPERMPLPPSCSPSPPPPPASPAPSPPPDPSPSPPPRLLGQRLQPQPHARARAPSRSPQPQSDGPVTTRSGRLVKPPGEFWKVKPSHPYQDALERHRADRRDGPSASPAEEQLNLLESANAVRALSDAELIEYAFLSSGTEPRTYREASQRDDAGLWKQAAEAEIGALDEHGVYELCELPAGRKAIGSRWVFKIKENSDGSIERYKARLVAQGFSQKPHLDYTETFAPVAKFASLRTVLAIAAIEDMEIHSMDISSAFLYGDLDEEIYMRQPEGFAAPGQEQLVWRLKKSLYGLKQSPRQWYQRLNDTFTSLGFSRCASDRSVWVWAKDGIKIVIPVYVDDLTMACNNTPALLRIKNELKKRYKLRDLGPVDYILGIKVIRDRSSRKLYLSQRKHIDDILAKFNLAAVRPVSTPLSKAAPLTKEDSPSTAEEIEYMRSVPYLSAVGSLMYLAVGTRPDIAYAVGALSRFNSNPGRAHWKAVQHVFKYLAGTRDQMLCYSAGRDGTTLQVFSDADYAGDVDSARSTSGYAVFVGSCLVNWSSKRQPVVAKSTTEAEYIAANDAGSDGVWFRHFMSELGYPPSTSTTLFLDNQSAIRVGKNPEHHSRMRHLLPKYHWLREQVEDKVFSLEYVATTSMRADVLTKPLEPVAHERVCSLLGLVSQPAL